MLTRILYISLFLSFLLLSPFLSAAPLEPIRLSPDGKKFILANSKTEFRVWGVNYDHDSTGNGRLLEDYWHTEWSTVTNDFQEIKDLGANVVRIHLQLGKFMLAADTPNKDSLARLADLLRLAEQLGLYLDITGLAAYHKSDTPPWYDALTDLERWKVQAAFWSAVARTCRHSNAVFCYDLMNEPVVEGKPEEGWVTGELAGKSFVQRLTLNRGDRSPAQIVQAWTQLLTRAIRAEDPHHLITVGVIPWSMVWPGAKDIFYSPENALAFDFVSIHVYPKSNEIEKALAALDLYTIGKPILIEETFPLTCTIEEMDRFLNLSRPRTAGHISFYWGRTIRELSQANDLPSAITRDWLTHFKSLAPKMKQPLDSN
jgi:hypothetical protein